MKTITLYNVDKNEVLLNFTTKKSKESSIQHEIVEKVKEKYDTRVWLQGSIRYGQPGNTLQLGGNLWWLIPDVCDKAQYTIE